MSTTPLKNEAATTTAVIGSIIDLIATVEVPAEEEGEASTYVSTIENIIGGAGMTPSPVMTETTGLRAGQATTRLTAAAVTTYAHGRRR